ncbi:MAG: sigma-70 family RNA polymerase sigma factor [Methylococcales bacterium]
MTRNRSNPAEWLDLYGDALYRYAMVRLRDEHLAEDLVQETLLAGLNARERFAGNAAEKTWLIGILKHKIVDHFRKSSRETVQNTEDATIGQSTESCFDERGRWTIEAGAWSSPDKSLEQDQFWSVLADCVEHLPRRLDRLFALREIDGLASEEILEVLNISTANNLWVMLSRMRLQLRNCLDTHWFAENRR